MKNKTLSLFGILVAFLFLFSACEETEIEKANEDYNFDNVIPMIFDFTGPTLLPASGLGFVEYSCLHRGGSTYAFTTEGHTATINIKEGHPNIAEVTWDQSAVNVAAKIFVVETTAGGKTSDPDTIDVALTPFCAMTISDFVGTWTGTETGSCENAITVTFEAGTAENTIVARATSGIPAFLGCVFTGWGEVFQAGFGNEGDIILTLGLTDGSVTINLEYWGQTLPGPYDYDQNGSGTWSGCGAAPTMSFDMLMDASGWRSSHLELTKQ